MSDEFMRAVAVVVDRGKGAEVAEFGRENKIDYAFLTYGKGTLRGELLQVLGLGTVDKDIVLSLLPRGEVKTHLAGLSGLLKLRRPGKGIAFSMPLSALNALVAGNIESAFATEEGGEVEQTIIKSAAVKFSLIVAVVESGYADQVMDAAKKKGASGGTLLHARGVGRETGEALMGTPLQTEKEITLILAERAAHREIMEEINRACGVLTEAKGVVFSLPVDGLAGIGD